MSSFLFRKSPSSKVALAAMLAAFALSGQAHSQSAPELGQMAPLPAAVGPDGRPVEAPKPVALPEGASIGDAAEKVRGMATEAGKSLDQLIGSAVVPRTAAEAGQMADRQRSIMMLEYQLKEAKLAKELWIELNGEKEGSSEDMERMGAEKAALEAEILRLQNAQIEANRAPDPDPVVAEVTGAAGSFRAKVLIPYAGEILVSNGSTLPNGMRVVGISKDGVRVTGPGGAKTLAFGTSVPRVRPAAPVASGADGVLRQVGN